MILEYDKKYKDGYTKLIKLLWKDIKDKEIHEIITNHELKKDKIFLEVREKEVIGFINLSVRNDYVEGCTSLGTGYIEGVYVCRPHRRNQIAYNLVNHAVSFFKSIGLSEIGSDTEIENEMSQMFHKMMGFKEKAILFEDIEIGCGNDRGYLNQILTILATKNMRNNKNIAIFTINGNLKYKKIIEIQKITCLI